MKILLATDGSAASHDAEWFLSRVPFLEPIELTLATVLVVPQLPTMRREFPSSIQSLLDEYNAHAQELLDEDAARFEGINGTVETKILSGHAADELVSFASEQQCDLIVLGARGRSPSQRFLLGSVSQLVAKHAPCSVLVTRSTAFRTTAGQPLRILICHDGSESSRQAVQMLAQIHWGEGVEITVLSVFHPVLPRGRETAVDIQSLSDQERKHAEESLAWAVNQLEAATPHVKSELRDAEAVANEIVETIEQRSIDFVVMGDRGRSRIERFFLGSTSDSVLRHAPCSVWIVRNPRTSL